jgi:alpha-galactosidase
MPIFLNIVLGLSVALSVARADPNGVTPSELERARAWAASNLGLTTASQASATAPAAPSIPSWPFSFSYGDRAFAELCAGWEFERTATELGQGRTQHTLLWRDPKTRLSVRCVAVAYRDHPTIEWTLYFKNDGATVTPIVKSIQALDVPLEQAGNGDFVLHHAVGSPADGSDYSPIETRLGPKGATKIGAAGGRPTNSDLCFFNLQRGDSGWMIAVGWPGQWVSEFARVDQAVRVRIGQELTHLKLLPGEEIRSPLIVLQFWQGDRDRSQNIWRRWMIAYNLPRPGGRLPPPQLAASSSRAYGEMIHADEANQIVHIDRYVEERIGIDYWWMDAGWYVNKTGWPNVGTWEVDTKRFPRGLRAISDYARTKGMKTVVWFEPERVTPGTWLYEKHPEWLLGPDGQQKLLNLGNPQAWKWLVDHIDHLITEQGVGLYRQDFNIDPLSYWRAADAPDRQGITENKYVSGHLAYWDELRRRHPDMLIDCCASGGRRNDLETLRRAVPLWRSDYAFEPVGHQNMTCGISSWIPYHGTGTVACVNAPYYGAGATPVEPYAFWSNVAPALGLGIDIRERGLDYDALRRLIGQWRAISECYYGDFYPLAPCIRRNDVWAAWQFDRPDLERGVVQAFRRAESPYESARFRLRGLDPDGRYVVTNLDAKQPTEITGRDLAEDGLLITMPQKPAASVITYRRKP